MKVGTSGLPQNRVLVLKTQVAATFFNRVET